MGLYEDMEKESDSKSSRKKPKSTKKQVSSSVGNYNVLNDANNSTKDQYSAIKMHLDCMLSKHRKEYEGKYKKKLPLSFDKITYNHVNCHFFVSCVCHFLGNNARQYGKDKNDLLAWKAADQYLSAFKTYFSRVKFSKKDEPIPFQSRFWSLYRSRLETWKRAEKNKDGKGGNLVNPKEAATEEDRWAIFAMCCWSNSLRGSLFCLIFNLLIQIGGRVSEASTMLKSDLKAKVSVSKFVMKK